MFLFVGHFLNQNLRVFEEELGQLAVQVPLVLVPLAPVNLPVIMRGVEDVVFVLVVLVVLVPLVAVQGMFACGLTQNPDEMVGHRK